MEERLVPGAAIPRGATLLLPAVTIGNVGQLAVDLIIQSLDGVERLGSLRDEAVTPVVGSSAFAGSLGAAASLELYLHRATGLVVLQQRAPTLAGCQRPFARRLLDWVEASGFARLVLAGSIESGSLRASEPGALPRDAVRAFVVGTGAAVCGGSSDAAVASPTPPPAERGAGDATVGLGADRDLAPLPPPLPLAWFEGRGPDVRLAPPWPLLAEAQTRNVEIVALLLLAAEGNNLPEGIAEAEAVAEHLGLPLGEAPRNRPWQFPPSFNGLFGARRADIVY